MLPSRSGSVFCSPTLLFLLYLGPVGAACVPTPKGDLPTTGLPDADAGTGTCTDTCFYAGDGKCDDGRPGAMSDLCAPGTDCRDCSQQAGDPSAGTTCTDTCDWHHDGECDDGRPGSITDLCALGTDCADCGGGTGSGTDPDGAGPPADPNCNDTCGWANDGYCDDGRPIAVSSECAAGSDCTDCGPPLPPLTGLLEVPCAASEASVEIVHNAPRETALEIVFVAVGFTAADMNVFCERVDSMAQGLGYNPDWGDYWSRINVHRLATTNFGAGYQEAFNDSGSYLELPPHLQSLKSTFDAVAMVVKVPEGEYGRAYAGVDGPVLDHRDSGWVVAHELGHTVVALADEYGEQVCQLEELFGAYREINVVSSTNPAEIPWGDLITPGTPLPTPTTMAEATGAFTVMCDDGRASNTHVAGAQCLMLDAGSPMCAACRRELDRFMAAFNGQNADMSPAQWGRACPASYYSDRLCDSCDLNQYDAACDAAMAPPANEPTVRTGCLHGGLPERLHLGPLAVDAGPPLVRPILPRKGVKAVP